ncbi:hypothetical protein LQR31_04610 [Chromobacterium vaccinii]|uniref:hypothetical protein n=1 Tax=Chromobacterium vaccinii TaxID=1108595 RepID=UPI001E345F83|nr:hypothetical protein [Chromobacterium vaccinii]MCD4483757.1 hypothetical protein [Chromobacterium vaccinii]
MSNNNSRQTIRVRGNSNIVGNNNKVNSRHEEHHHHHHHGKSSSSGGDDAAGAGLGIIFVVLLVCWIFVRHAAEIYLFIKIGAVVSVIPVFCVRKWLGQ